ncbi:MAG: FAD-dependent oxidoreductase [Candidatus Nomurabacteria bacterium]|nr:FAD-dependent oxidoreductase [Candidatus Nomurabacteria bacterium]USN87294.1 MAG: FAD-dependent oxidoreductase [Candidatus Nomurabacteria bacterium]
MYDIIIIGAGSGGLNVASFMNSIGLKVLLIDKSADHIGGDCLNTGCVPSKALIHVARKFKEAKDASRFGLKTEGEVNLDEVMAYVKSTQDIIRTHESADHFRSKGMDVVLGEANFESKNSVKVGDQVYKGKKIIIATGSRPRTLSIPGIEVVQEAGRLFTNENIFSLTSLPKRLLVIGAGPIGIELGQAFRHFGSAVDMVTIDDRILPREDGDISSILFDRLIKDGVNFHFNKNSLRFENGDTLVIEDRDNKTNDTITFDAVLVSIGRVLNTESLALQKAGVAVNERGKIVVDDYLRTTNKNILVCGDVVGQHQFTHAAEIHAGVIIRNFLTPLFKNKLSTDAISWVTYTSPELATYGLSETELQKRGIKYAVLESSFAEDDRAITDDARYGHAKMFVETSSKKILGGTMVAPNAGELIQELILATQNDLTVNAIFNKTYPYPTAARINKRLVAEGQRQRLTPRVKSIMRWLYRLQA